MANISLDHRRQVMILAATDAWFRDLVLRDPRRALASVTGGAVRAGRVTVVQDEPTCWTAVMPWALPGPALPAPFDTRTTVENRVFELLSAKPELAGDLKRDPTRFLRDRLGIDLEGFGVEIQWEAEDEVLLAISMKEADRELDDELLDLVSGGVSDTTNASGTPTCNPPNQKAGVRT